MEEQVFLAKNYLERGNAEHAVKLLAQLQLVPEKSEHLNGLIVLVEAYNDVDKDSEAIELAKELLRLHPTDVDVRDCVLHLYSSFRELASEAEQISFDLKKEYPNSSYYSYMIAYLGHTWLSRTKEHILEHLEDALRLSGQESYLRTAFDIYHSFGMTEDRRMCTELMVEYSPDSLGTRRCLVLEKLYTKSYQEAAELSIELLKDFPQETWIVEKIDEVKELLYGNHFEKILQRAYWKVEHWMDKTKYPAMVYVYLGLFYVFLAVFVFLGALVAPLFLVKFVLVDDTLHIKRLKNDSLYRTLAEVSDLVQQVPGGIAFLFTSVTDSTEVVLFDDEKVITGKGIHGSFRNLQFARELDYFVKPKVSPIREVKEILIRETEFSIAFHKESRLDKDFDFVSLDVPKELAQYLLDKQWIYEGVRKQGLLEILSFCTLFFLLGTVQLLFDWPGEYGAYLQIAFVIVVFSNTIFYLCYRLKNPVVSEVYRNP